MPERNSLLNCRSWKLAACLLALLAMFSSAVSACACTHHEDLRPETEQTADCHSSSHDETVTATEESVISDNFRAGCNCLPGTPVPAITAKSESKKFAVQKLTDPEGESFFADTGKTVSGVQATVAYSTHPFYSGKRYLTSGPSRAPPRL